MSEAESRKPLDFGSVAWRIFIAPWPSTLIYLFYDAAKESIDLREVVNMLNSFVFLGSIFGILALVFGSALWALYQGLRITSPLAYAVGAASLPTAIFLFLDQPGGYSGIRGCVSVVDSVRTDCGWWMFAENLTLAIGLGALAGLVLWGLLRWRLNG